MITLAQMLALKQCCWPIWAAARGSRIRYAVVDLTTRHNYAIWTAIPATCPQPLDVDQIHNQDLSLEVAIQYGTKRPIVQAVDHIQLGHYEDQPYWHIVLGTKL